MKSKHKKTLTAIFATPTRANIKFSDIESLVIALGEKSGKVPGLVLCWKFPAKGNMPTVPTQGKKPKDI